MIARLTVLIAVLLVAGCASFTEEHSRTLLMNRNTGEMQECTVSKWRSAGAYEEYKACITSFEEQGYTIWSQY